MAPNLGNAAVVVSVALLAGISAVCGGGEDADSGLTASGALTPTIVSGATEAARSPTSTETSVLDPWDDPTPDVEEIEQATLEPTPTFDPGDVILPTVVPPPVEVPDPLDTDLEMRLDEIEPAVAALRELYAFDDTNRRFITQAELEERLAGDLEEQREEFDELGRLYAILGITEPEMDLHDLFLDLYSSSVLGFFDPELNELFVVDATTTELSPQDHLTYIHEFVHALQQQHFDIGSVLDSDEIQNNSDRATAYRALFEGDATLLETIYMFQNMTQQEQADAQDLGIDLSAFFAAPHMVQRTFLFPYLEGAQFVLQVFAETGWKGVNALYERVPVSTEQVMHPAKYQLAEQPIDVDLPVLEEALGEGWSELQRDTFGEFSLAVYLEDRIPQDQAATAGAGWGGDRYALYAGPGDLDLLVHRLAWDTVGDAEEFLAAFATFTEAWLQAEWDLLDGEEGAIRMVSPQRVIYAVNRGAITDLVFAPDHSVLSQVTDRLSPGSGSEAGLSEPVPETSTEPLEGEEEP